ncbi:MAG TPA: hypothetical protein VKA00_07125 [Trueperaceae bacterium]|nr:hypothetical protein [Trueperaceae bacterium]
MSWLDLVLALVVATVTALGMHRRLSGFFVGLGGALLLHPLLVVAHANPFLALVAAWAAGLGLSMLGRRLFQLNRGAGALMRVLGGLGGLALGVALVLSLVTSLPIQRNPANPNELFYPPRNLPVPIAAAVTDSRLVLLGRDILLYPLLTRQGDVNTGQERVLQGLHRLFVVGEPWNESL